MLKHKSLPVDFQGSVQQMCGRGTWGQGEHGSAGSDDGPGDLRGLFPPQYSMIPRSPGLITCIILHLLKVLCPWCLRLLTKRCLSHFWSVTKHINIKIQPNI